MLERILRPRGAPTTVVVVDELGACDNYNVDRLPDIMAVAGKLSRLDDLDAHLLKVEADE